MGCICSMIRKRNGFDDSVYLDAPLTDPQKRKLNETWALLSIEIEKKGTRMFKLLFHKNPFIKNLFPFRNLDGDELESDPSFVAHAHRFMNTLGQVMHNLDRYKEIVAPQLVELGRRHANFIGFKPNYFNHFEEAMMDVFSEDLGPIVFDVKAVEAWRVVFRFILIELKRGFTLALRDRGKQMRECCEQQYLQYQREQQLKELRQKQQQIEEMQKIQQQLKRLEAQQEQKMRDIKEEQLEMDILIHNEQMEKLEMEKRQFTSSSSQMTSTNS
ncbi:hypothetical protein HELRODRAFT_176761 [Helobdella robusta]|uniref:Globin domain-containing protein n=1 Tax=Helobdella robusta TaxID=6412 RepID=T1FAW0_HELRO|nr:hypothetical protein HELRODRAFT_176761 [Helobdella robusta]ESN99596.1 hypothetical protein HELRODRAFT_176761 [Helobdella robusta]